MADQDLDHGVYVARPRRVRMIAIIASIALCVLAAIGWLLLPDRGPCTVSVVTSVSAAWHFRVPDCSHGDLGKQLCTRQRVGPSDSQRICGYTLVPWERVHKIILRPGDPWAQLLLKPADGRPFEADLDADRRQLMGIQTVDGPLATAAVNGTPSTPPPLPARDPEHQLVRISAPYVVLLRF